MAGGRGVCGKRETWKDVLGMAIPLQTSCPSHQHHDALHICFLLNCLWSTSTTALCKVEICTPTADVLNPESPCLATVLSLCGSFTPISSISFFFSPAITECIDICAQTLVFIITLTLSINSLWKKISIWIQVTVSQAGLWGSVL